jgi:hypothetical protein
MNLNSLPPTEASIAFEESNSTIAIRLRFRARRLASRRLITCPLNSPILDRAGVSWSTNSPRPSIGLGPVTIEKGRHVWA